MHETLFWMPVRTKQIHKNKQQMIQFGGFSKPTPFLETIWSGEQSSFGRGCQGRASTLLFEDWGRWKWEISGGKPCFQLKKKHHSFVGCFALYVGWKPVNCNCLESWDRPKNLPFYGSLSLEPRIGAIWCYMCIADFRIPDILVLSCLQMACSQGQLIRTNEMKWNNRQVMERFSELIHILNGLNLANQRQTRMWLSRPYIYITKPWLFFSSQNASILILGRYKGSFHEVRLEGLRAWSQRPHPGKSRAGGEFQAAEWFFGQNHKLSTIITILQATFDL